MGSDRQQSRPPIRRLGRRDWVEIYLRSLALQASWNAQRMQNLGLLATLVPWLRRNGDSLEERRRFCRRHYEFFNTNPYLANFVVGGILRLESDRAAVGTPDTQTVRVFRDSLARAFAGLGDQLYWLGLRPTLMLLTAVAVLSGQMGAVVVILGVFTLAQLEVRRRALLSGARCGFDLVDVLGHDGWHRAINASKNAGKLLTGMVLGCFFARILAPESGAERLGPVLALALGAVLPPAARKRLPGEALLLIAAALAAILTYGL